MKNGTDAKLYVSIKLSGNPLIGDDKDAENDLNMEVVYLDLAGKKISPKYLEQGTDFIAQVSITNPGGLGGRDYREMALSQIFPSGWEIHNTRMDTYETDQLSDKPTYMDIRDDRVYTYFDVAPAKRKVYRTLLNATYEGRYYLPSVYCEAMYDVDINAKKGGQWVEVVRPGTEIAGN